jgi:hypothetical protein
MTRTTPRVHEAMLVAASSAAGDIAVGTPAWFAWLDQATTFAGDGRRAPYAHQLRRRRRPHGGDGYRSGRLVARLEFDPARHCDVYARVQL